MAANAEYNWREGFTVTADIINTFNKTGYVIIRGLFSSEEHQKLQNCLEHEHGVKDKFYEKDDGAGRKSKTVAWNYPRDDITGMIARCDKVAGTFEMLLGGELYHYHSKVIMKEARCGGQHAWHQDYGYWYVNGCMYPAMGTVWTPIDKTDQGNGCIQGIARFLNKLLSGSHLLGRVEHERAGQQVGADLERVAQAKKILPLVYAELDKGDAIFFHCNVLHRSDQNSSDRRRWGYAIAYNRKGNDPVYNSHHPKYIPLNKVRDSAIMDCRADPDDKDPEFLLGPKDKEKDFEFQNIGKVG